MKRWFGLDYTVLRDKASDDGADEGSGDADGTKDEGAEDGDEDNEEDDAEEGEGEGDDEELDEADALSAKQLFKALKNPDTQVAVITAMAMKAGLEFGKKGEAPTKSEIKEAKINITAALKETLGKDYEFLADKIGPAFEKILKQQEDSFNERLSLNESKQTDLDIDRIYSKLNRETKGDFGKFEKQIAQLADEILPAPGVSTETYVRRLYGIAKSSGNGASSPKKDLANKINRNANDAAGRLSSSGGGTSGKGIPKLPENATIRQIIEHEANKLERA